MNKYLVFIFVCLLAIIAYGQTSCSIEKTTKESLLQAQSQYHINSDLSSLTTYTHLEDTVYAGKLLPAKKIDKKETMPPDSLRVLLIEKILNLFDEDRKQVLKETKQWFLATIYIDGNGILKEVEYTLSNKFEKSNPKTCVNELDLLKIDQHIKGMQLVLPKGWKEIGYARIIYPIRF